MASLVSLFTQIQKPAEAIEVNEEYTYIEPQKERVYSIIQSTNKSLANFFQSNTAYAKKTTKQEERANTIDYFNSVQDNLVRLTVSEIYDVKIMITDQFLGSNNRKGNITNAIIYELIYLQEKHSCAFGLQLLWVAFPVLRKHTTHSFNKKYNDIYDCLSLLQPGKYKNVYLSYFDLPAMLYYRGLRIIARTFYNNMGSGSILEQGETGIDDTSAECISICSMIERLSISLAIIIIINKTSYINASRIDDYYKIYCFICVLIISKTGMVSQFPTELRNLINIIEGIEIHGTDIGINNTFMNFVIHVIRCLFCQSDKNAVVLQAYFKRIKTLFMSNLSLYEDNDLEYYISTRCSISSSSYH